VQKANCQRRKEKEASEGREARARRGDAPAAKKREISRAASAIAAMRVSNSPSGASSGSLLTSSCLSIVRRERGRYPVDKSACLIKVTRYEDKVIKSLRDLAINYALRSLSVT